MAILKKNGAISGAIGSIIFSESGDKTVLRSKPDGIRQSDRTKSAAKVFGVVSEREKIFRNTMLHKLGIPAMQHFAARHRARIHKTVVHDEGSLLEGKPRFGSPEALAGFDFNPKLPWSSCTNFFPVIHRTAGCGLVVELPELRWREHVKPPRKATGAVLTLTALAADFNQNNIHTETLGTVTHDFSKKHVYEPQEWQLEGLGEGGWLVVACALRFEGGDLEKTGRFAGTYLWAGEDVVNS